MIERIIIQTLAFICIGISIVLVVIGIFIGVLAHGKGVEFNYVIYWFPIVVSPFAISGILNIVLGLLDTTRPIKSPNALRWRLMVGLIALSLHAFNGYKLGDYYYFILLILFSGFFCFAYMGREFWYVKNS